MKQTDLIIVGGGPAGLAAAVSAYKSGIRDIIIFERDDFSFLAFCFFKTREQLIKRTITQHEIIDFCSDIFHQNTQDNRTVPLSSLLPYVPPIKLRHNRETWISNKSCVNFLTIYRQICFINYSL